MMLVDNKYNIGDIVYLITDEDSFPRIVNGIQLSPNNGILYRLACGTNETWHYDFEMSTEKINVIKQ